MRFELSGRVFGSVWMGTGDFAGDADGTGSFKTGLGPDYGSVEGTEFSFSNHVGRRRSLCFDSALER